MTFDARSKERLAALGRSLPQKLPAPHPADASLRQGDSTKRDGSGGIQGGRHPVEKEEDPAELFRALMQASPDGSVPPHLLDRLRELEGPRRQPPSASAAEAAPSARPSTRPARKRQQRSGPRPESPDAGDQDLYTMFTQLLLEEEDND